MVPTMFAASFWCAYSAKLGFSKSASIMGPPPIACTPGVPIKIILYPNYNHSNLNPYLHLLFASWFNMLFIEFDFGHVQFMVLCYGIHFILHLYSYLLPFALAKFCPLIFLLTCS